MVITTSPPRHIDVTPKKLGLAKRAWKGFSNTLQSKFPKLNNIKIKYLKAIKTTIQRLLAAFHSLRYFIIPSRTRRPRSLTTATSYSLSHKQIHQQNLPSKDPASSSSSLQGETSRVKEVVENKDLLKERSGIDNIEDAWKAVVAKSPLLRVDERAEEFIHKFREDMKLQKERSLLEFQEMLAPSA